MKDNELGYDPDVLMSACIQAAATALAAKGEGDPTDPEAIARLGAQIRDEALMHF